MSCIYRERNITKWLALIDLDEFLIPEKNISFKEILKKFKKNLKKI
jgi:hypothetical protein